MLSKMTFPISDNLEKPKGNMEWEELGYLYLCFIRSIEKNMKIHEKFISTCCFAYSDNKEKKTDFFVFGITEENLKDKTINEIIGKALRLFPVDEFTLEAIMYAADAENPEENKEGIGFSAGILSGHTIHNIYSKIDGKYHLEKHDALNKWTKEQNKVDEFLDFIIKKYLTVFSVIKLFPNIIK